MIILLYIHFFCYAEKYSSSDNICCSVHTLLWTFLSLSILVRLRLPRLGQSAEISIQRWTFCKDIARVAILRNAIIKGAKLYISNIRRLYFSYFNRKTEKRKQVKGQFYQSDKIILLMQPQHKFLILHSKLPFWYSINKDNLSNLFDQITI